MRFIYLVRSSIALTLIVIVLGAYTRLSDAGLGCPDWPGCYGHLTVPDDSHEVARAQRLFPEAHIEPHKAWLEMIHRYVAGVLGMMIFAITALSIRRHDVSKTLSVLISVVVIFQAMLGMWTVTMKLNPLVVMGHLLGGFTLLCLLCLFYWQLTRAYTFHAPVSFTPSLKWLSIASMVCVVVQIALGGWTSANYAAFMCSELPFCEGSWTRFLNFKEAFTLVQPPRESYEFGTLDYGARMTIHFTHRIGALVVCAILLALITAIYRHSLHARKLGLVVAGLLVTQIALGISNVLFSLPLLTAVAHNLVAALLLVSVLYTMMMIWRADHFADKAQAAPNSRGELL